MQAEFGLASITGRPEAPARVGVSVSDIGSGMNAYAGDAGSADRARPHRRGATISVSLFDAMAEWMTVPLLSHEGGHPFRRIGLAHAAIAPYGVFKSRDDADILISIQNDREWRVLADKVLGNTALATDPTFATNIQRVAHRSQTDAAVAAAFARHDVNDLMAMLENGRYRVRTRERLRAPVIASASAPYRSGHAKRAGRDTGASADHRLAAKLRRRAGPGRA